MPLSRTRFGWFANIRSIQKGCIFGSKLVCSFISCELPNTVDISYNSKPQGLLIPFCHQLVRIAFRSPVMKQHKGDSKGDSNDLLLTKGTLGVISDTNSGIRWGHINAGVYSPTNHPFDKLAFEGAKRLESKSSVSRQKEPITTEMIKQCVATHKNPEDLMHLRFMIICIIWFAGFLPISEILEINIKHISIFDDRVEILIPKSKTDPLKEGHIVHIAKTETAVCSRFWMLKYLKVSKLDKEPESFLICRIYKTNKGHNTHGKEPLSYSRAREIFMEQLALIFPETDVKVFGLHSLRSEEPLPPQIMI